MYCKKRSFFFLHWALVGVIASLIVCLFYKCITKKCKQAEDAVSACLCRENGMESELDSDN